jgi:hypothetical protein
MKVSLAISIFMNRFGLGHFKGCQVVSNKETFHEQSSTIHTTGKQDKVAVVAGYINKSFCVRILQCKPLGWQNDLLMK